jgi:hypothetical protein
MIMKAETAECGMHHDATDDVTGTAVEIPV